MFHDIAWSTERVAARTLERAHEIGLDMHRLPVWYDVDDVDDLTRLYVDLDGAASRQPYRGVLEPLVARSRLSSPRRGISWRRAIARLSLFE